MYHLGNKLLISRWCVQFLNLLSNSIFTLCAHGLISPAGSEYDTVTTTLTFNVSVPTQVVTIPIRDDLVVEDTKSFTVALATNDTAVTLRLQNATVSIRDNDSKLQLYSLY